MLTTRYIMMLWKQQRIICMVSIASLDKIFNALYSLTKTEKANRTKLYNDAGVLGRARIRGDKELAKQKRLDSFNSFKKAAPFPQNVFNSQLTDWDKVYNEFSQLLGEDGALNLLTKYFNQGGK